METSVEPYTDEDGTVYELALSDNSTGYAHVQEVRGGQFHAKLTLPNENKQTTLPGGACASAQLAALRVAKFKAGVLEVVKMITLPKQMRSFAKVKRKHRS